MTPAIFHSQPWNGWGDSAISVDVGCFGQAPEWVIEDGNHRVYAAILRGDETILACVSGDVDLANLILEPTSPW